MLVMKFGGTSVKDADAIRRLTQIVARARTAGTRTHAAVRGPLVVVSALSKVTDGLLAVSACAASGGAVSEVSEREKQNPISAGAGGAATSPVGASAARARAGAQGASRAAGSVASAIEALRLRHHEVAAGVVRDAGRLATLTAAIDGDLAELTTLVHALSVVHDASPRLQDAIAAIGELLSSRIVAAALEQAGLPASWVDARTVLVTDAEIPASPLMDETRARCGGVLLPLIARGRVPVLGGFIGATAAGVTTTLGRGGSDYSASIFGVSVGAAEIQIWTDVDGMLTADPRVIAGARPLPRLSFAEASELAYFGAKVLHPSTITPAVAEEIPVRILNSQRPDVPGTLITREGDAETPALTAIACKRDVTVIDIVSTRMLMAHGFLRRLFEVFERHRTAVDVVTTSEVSVSVTIDDVRRLDDIVRDLSAFAEVSITGDMALVCAVGERLRTDPSLCARLVGALDGFPLRMLSQAGSRRNVTFVLPQADLVDAMQHLHERFCISEPITITTATAITTPEATPVGATPAPTDRS